MVMKLKLKVNTGQPKSPASSIPPTPAPISAATPGGSRPKLKFTSKSIPSTPAPIEEPAPKKTKAGRAPKPSAKILASKKREREDSNSEDEGSTIAVHAPPKKVKISFGGPKTPLSAIQAQTPILLKPKLKGKPPKRTNGEGYDSEASDREIDPTIEEEFILRMLPGDDCEYLRAAINDKKIGVPISQGGPNIQMKFFHNEGRRAAVIIKGRPYAATLVDLPCIIEGMKSWDKRGWWKSADICQMLWVFARVDKEEEAKTIPLPNIIDKETHQYPHGITPPLHYARKRRFRKGISRNAIEAVEDAIEKLLAADDAAVSTKFEMIDPDMGRQSQMYSPAPGASPGENYDDEDQYSEDDDAEGEEDDNAGSYFDHAPQATVKEEDDDDMNADLEADLEAALFDAEGELDAELPISTPDPSVFLPAAETLVAAQETEDDSGDESIEGDDGEDEDEDEEVEIDEDEKARLAQIQGTKEDIADLTRQIELVQGQLTNMNNPLLRRRLEENARKLKAELQLKKSSIGEGDDD
jgi:transcription initiation factor TFIID subunit 7